VGITIKEDIMKYSELPKFTEPELFENYSLNITKRWFWFNRLNVPKQIRGRGIAKKLLQQVTGWADRSKINIINLAIPSGSLDIDRLTALYRRFGFRAIDNSLMIREYE